MRPGLQLMKHSEAHLSVALQMQTKSAHTVNIFIHIFLSLRLMSVYVPLTACLVW